MEETKSQIEKFRVASDRKTQERQTQTTSACIERTNEPTSMASLNDLSADNLLHILQYLDDIDDFLRCERIRIFHDIIKEDENDDQGSKVFAYLPYLRDGRKYLDELEPCKFFHCYFKALRNIKSVQKYTGQHIVKVFGPSTWKMFVERIFRRNDDTGDDQEEDDEEEDDD